MADDEQNNPSKNVADEAYQRTFKTGKKLQDMESAAADGNKDKEVSKSSEKNADKTHWKTHGIGASDKKKSSHRKTLAGRIRHGSAYLFVIGLILLGVWFASVFAPNIILVNIKEMYTDDLADATVALYTYNNKIMDNYIGKADCGKKESIKCKLSTMPRQMVKSLEKAGFTVNGSKVDEDNLDDNDPSNDKPESRYKVTSIEFPHGGGTATDGDSFNKNADKSSAMKALVYSVFNPKSSFFMDQRYKQRIKWRYDLTKDVTVSGNTEDEVNKSFDKSMQGSDEKMDDTGGGNFSLKGLAGDVGKNGLIDTSKRISGITNAYVGIQCAYYTQAKVAYASMKKAKSVTVARFAMQYLKAADQIKAGLAEEIPANVLSSKLAWSDDGGYNGKNATDGSMYRNVVFNEPAKNENGWQYSLDTFDTPGALLPAWLLTLFLTAPAVKGIAHISDGDLAMPSADLGDGARKYCLEGQKDSNKAGNKPSDCPALTVSGTPPPMQPAVAPIAALSDRICPPPPRGVWMMYPTSKMTVETVMPYVANVFNGVVSAWANTNINNFTSNTKGTQASEALFAGTGEILGDMAMSRGMRPGDEKSMSEYLSAKADIDKQFEEVGRYNASKAPFDPMNQYSFMGTLVRSTGIMSYDLQTPFLSSIGSIFSLVPTALGQLNSRQSADAFYYLQPRKFDPSRLSCNDQEYTHIGIKADTLCNVRYSMSKTELNAKVSSVLDYMLKSHSDLTQKNVQELQQRQQVTDHGADMQDQQDVSRQLQETQDASNKPEIDEKTGKPIPHSEYEKFMNYCVNRQEPWGRTGMAVRYKELSDDEKEKRFKDKDHNLNPVNPKSDSGDPYELKVDQAYMAVTEGASADQDWYTGKKCLEESEELNNFRAYTMLCSVDGSHSGGVDCTDKDNANVYFDGFYNNNDILYTSWW